MVWKLWLDDQILDPECPDRWAPEGFIGAASSIEALGLITYHGLPEFMDLDHDLGQEDNTMTFLKVLTERYPDGPIPEFRVHSANPVGKANIESYLNSWKKILSE